MHTCTRTFDSTRVNAGTNTVDEALEPCLGCRNYPSSFPRSCSHRQSIASTVLLNLEHSLTAMALKSLVIIPSRSHNLHIYHGCRVQWLNPHVESYCNTHPRFPSSVCGMLMVYLKSPVTTPFLSMYNISHCSTGWLSMSVVYQKVSTPSNFPRPRLAHQVRD